MVRAGSYIVPEVESATEKRHKREIIEEALRKDLRFLRFKKELERDFLDHYHRHSLNQARLAMFLGSAFYAAYGLLDYIMFSEVRTTFWAIRYGIFLPGLLLVFIALFFIKSERMLQVCLSLAILLAGSSVVVYNKIILGDFYIGLILIILFGCVVLPLRFRYAAISSLTVTSAYIGIIGINIHRNPVPVNNIFDLITANAFGLFACYLLEKYKRKEYLQLCLLNLEKEKLRELSLVDGLTNIANRRAFDDFLSREWNRALRFGHTVALLLIDVDHFKLYNDALGHQAGDECLCRIAEVLNLYKRRASDFVARYGGEEFVFMLSGTSSEYAMEVAEAIRMKVRDLQIPHPASSIDRNVTISIGVAFCAPTREMDKEELVKMADHALYQAKRNGRNRVVFLQGQ
jgi:diguanylate cyclase (GGDEF)-like protein